MRPTGPETWRHGAATYVSCMPLMRFACFAAGDALRRPVAHV